MIKLKRIKSISLLCIIFLIMFVILPQNVFADRTDVTQFDGGSGPLDNATTEIVDVILGVVQTVAGGVAVLSMIWIGIKYVMSAPEGRASYMKKFAIFVLGLTIVIFAEEIVREIAKI